ncbi:MAG TPA: protease inhibitor I42 family protein [Gaiellaceae bacterium]|jgi:predicted secreted protein
MRKRLLFVATGVVAAAALLSASLAVAGTTLHLTAKDNHKSFTVAAHTAIVITLKSNASTGYRWKRGHCSAVKFISRKYVEPASGRVGAAGKEIWRFKVVGQTTEGKIALRYVGPSKDVAHRFSVQLQIG